MIPREIFAQVRRIEIKTRRLVAETFGGKYLSVFKGQGIEFAEVREYVPGDDIRTIDWNVTARTGRPFVRRYQDERELTVLLACDMSGSQFFGTDLKFKKEIAAEIAALLAFSALRNNDKAGLFLFTDAAELYLPPRKGRSHILTLIRDLLAFEPKSRRTAIGASLDVLNRHLKRRSILFLLSDFMDRGFDASLRRTAIRHDLIPVLIEDPRELELPSIPALLEIEDPETGETTLINGRSSNRLRDMQRRRQLRKEATFQLFRSAGLDFIRIRTDQPYADPLIQFFRSRARRFR
ncbi:MAG: DUF58 domain-containing protein [Elusimicrobia bacterium]|nr:DUF58 domain-containing protein [Elusimicrobiota bacterium]